GTFEYYNEKAINKDGSLNEDLAVKFDANTLSIVEVLAEDESGTGVFNFYDKSQKEPIATINVPESVINNIVEILNDEIVQNSIYTTVANKGKKVTGDEAIAVTGGDKAALQAMTISLKDGGVTPKKIQAGGKKQILITNEKGEVVWGDATDEVIIDAVQKNERITLLEVQDNGTFVYYNELAVNSKGEIIGEGVEFDANTLSIEENTPGIFTFSDKKGFIKDIDIRASNIIIDDTTINSGNDNVQDVIETIFEIIKNIDSQKRDLKGNGILVNNGEVVANALLEEVELSIADNAITTAKLDTNAVINTKVANHAITEDKLWAGQGRENQVAVVQADGSVKFQEVNAIVDGKALTVDNSLDIEGDASKALLSPLAIKVNDLGIVTKHIDHNAVTADKIGSEEASKGSVLMAQGNGNSSFVTADSIIEGIMQADLKGDEETIHVKDGENVLFGNKDKEVKISIIKRGVKGSHIATNTIVDENIADTTITAAKLNGGENNVNAVATVIDAKGTVAYQSLKGDAISDKAALKTDGIITIGGSNEQAGTLLKEATLSIAPKGINTTQIADNAVNNLQIADLAVSSDKITSGTVGTGRVLLSDVDGKTKWGELDDITTQLAGDLTTDDIIQLTSQDGEGKKALLKDVKLSIKDNSITKDKLSSKENDVPVGKDKILVTNDKGGFDYVSKGAFESGGEDLYVGDALEFTVGDGLNTVLVETKIDVKEGGIHTGKLAEGAVTVTKISSKGADNNTVLTADGEGNVAYKKLTDSAFEGKGKDLKGDNSITVTANNKALLNDATISIAESGVQNEHIAGRAVTADKIGAEGTSNGLVLVTKDGGAEFSPISDAIVEAGKEIKGGSAIEVTKGNKAALQDVSIDVANLGITNAKIAERTIEASKFNATGFDKGTVLTSLGDGEAKYVPMNKYGKELKSDSSIEVSSNKALLEGVTIKVKNLGIVTDHLGPKVVTANKIGADKDKAGYVLTANSDGGATWEAVSGGSEVNKANINESSTITATKGSIGSVLQDVALEVKGLSIEGQHIKDNAISPAKINAKAVTTEKIDVNAVTTEKIANKSVTIAKIDSESANKGQVLTAQGDGTVKYTKMSDNGSYLKTDQDGPISIKAPDHGRILLAEATINIKEKSIDTKYIANTAVGYDQLQTDAVYGSIIKEKAITQDKIAKDAVGQDQLQIDAVYGSIIKDKGVTEKKISSHGANQYKVLTSDGKGGASWEYVSVDSGSGDLENSKTIEVAEGKGKGALFNDLKLEVIGGSIDTKHIADKAVGTAELQDESVTKEKIADNAVGYDQLQIDAVHSSVIKDKAITEEKIADKAVTEDKISSHGANKYKVLMSDGAGGASWEYVSEDSGSGDFEESETIKVAEGEGRGALFNDIKLEVKNASIENKHIVNESIRVEKISSHGANEFEVLMSDGDGGARWEKVSGGGSNIASPKFFYLPAIYVEMVSGQSTSIELYNEYKTQFGSPMLSSNGNSTLPVYDQDELNYYVTYYDKNVFEDVKLDSDGELHYKVKQGAKPTGRTFFNIVLEVK
ncbi:hypothetical protein, partial [Myroides odoratimimus]|uniref:hypothetical protein n=1 Tax=Myroides odoratimimus TaxID=76832 RepID=UPI003101839A